MDLYITFQPPPRSGDGCPSEPHQRHFPGVPASTASKIAEDFETFGENASEDNQCKLYRYHKSDPEASEDEVMVALDFGEITSVKTEPGMDPL